MRLFGCRATALGNQVEKTIATTLETKYCLGFRIGLPCWRIEWQKKRENTWKVLFRIWGIESKCWSIENEN